MHIYSAWNLDASQNLNRTELAAVLADLKNCSRLPNIHMNLAIVGLACCCGLRASEIGGLTLRDVVLAVCRQYLVIPGEFAKGSVPVAFRSGGTRARWPISPRRSDTSKFTTLHRAIFSIVRANGRNSVTRSPGTCCAVGFRPRFAFSDATDFAR